jgi:meiotically up-regulated gene 157 (Mug157) protein
MFRNKSLVAQHVIDSEQGFVSEQTHQKKSTISIERLDVTKQAPCSRERTEISFTVTGLIVSSFRTSLPTFRIHLLGLFRDVTTDVPRYAPAVIQSHKS